MVTHSEGISVVNPVTEQWEDYPCDVLTVAGLNEESCVIEMVDGNVELMMIGWDNQECRCECSISQYRFASIFRSHYIIIITIMIITVFYRIHA